MKKRINVSVLLITVIMLFASCSKESNDNVKQFGSYERSYKTWLNFKSTTNNSYIYVVTSGSVFGFRSKTVLTVTDGKVVRRTYVGERQKRDSASVSPVYEIYEQWTENSENIGSHHSGATALTLDEVYNKCRTEWLKVNEKENDVYFDAQNNGLISSCGYVPKGCMDDCFRGVTISSIEAL